jgi:predicted oxidoreductase
MKEFSNSSVIAGTMKWGSWGAKFSKTEMSRFIEHCLSLEINTFDCAAIYGGYTTESEFGAALKDVNAKDTDIHIITKCGIEYPCDHHPIALKHYDYTADAISASVERSLNRLQVNSLNLLLLHRPSPLMDPEVIFETVEAMKKSGKIKQFGVSSFTASQMALMRTKLEVSVNQIECSITQLAPLTDGTIDFHGTHGIATQCWSPLGSVFSGKGERENRILGVCHSLAKKYEVTPNAILIAWLLHHPVNLTPVLGTTNELHLTEMSNARSIDMEQIDWFHLYTASTGANVP